MPTSEAFDDLMDRWEDLFEQGKELSPEELCRDHPEFLDAARKCIRAMKAVGGGAGDTTVTGTPEQKSPPRSHRPEVPGYEILDELGRGGMGVVYRARQVSLKRLVALKMILREDLAGPAGVARFRAEAEALGQLQHPNIVQVFDVGESGGHPYFALELVPGGSLSGRLADGPMPPPAAAELVRTLARAVHFAHQRGFIHRDLKPGNVLLGPAGEPKITDFGLVKRWNSDGATADGAVRTASGEVLGTPAYMAPEQARGDARGVGPGADVYALGAILYHLLTGRIPFPGQSLLEVLEQVVKSTPTSPRSLRRAIPRDLDTICLKCLEKNPARRYLTADQLADDLQRFLDGKPILARQITPVMRFGRWCRRNPLLAGTSIAAFLALLATAAVSVVSAVRSERGRVDLQASRDRLGEALTVSEAHRKESLRRLAESYLDRGVGLCEQGEVVQGMWWLVRALESSGESPELRALIEADLAAWAGQVCALERVLEHPTQVLSAAVGPGDLFAAALEGEPGVRVWSLATGEPLPLEFPDPGPAVTGLSFHPVDPLLAAAGEDDRVRVWRVKDGATLLGKLPTDGPVSRLRFSGDGRWLGVQTGRGLSVRVVADGLRPAKPIDSSLGCVDFAFLPRGAGVVLADYVAKRLHFWDVAAGQSGGPSVPTPQAPWLVVASPDGRYLASTDVGNLPNVYDGEKRLPHAALPGNPVLVNRLAFDRGSTFLLMARASGAATLWNVPEYRPHGSAMAHTGLLAAALFTPDGSRVVTTAADRTTRVWRMPPNTARVLPHSRFGKVIAAAVSPDGGRVATAAKFFAVVNKDVVEKQQVVLWDARSGAKLHTHDVPASGVRFDHSGQWVLTWGELNRVHLLDTRTGQFSAGPTPGAAVLDALFSPDGGRIFLGTADGMVHVWDRAQGKPALAPLQLGEPVGRLVPNPQGTRLLAAGGPNHTYGKGKTVLWEATTGERLAVLDPGNVTPAAAFSPDGRWLVTAAPGGTIRVWDAATGVAVGTLEGHSSEVKDLAFHPDGRTLASGSDDGTARLWNLERREPAGVLRHPPSGVKGVYFSPDGRTLLTRAAGPGVARLWDLTTLRQIGPPLVYYRALDSIVPYQQTTVAFAPDGKSFLVAGETAARLIPVPVALDRGPEFWANWLRARTGQELDAAGAFHVLGADAWVRAAVAVPADR